MKDGDIAERERREGAEPANTPVFALRGHCRNRVEISFRRCDSAYAGLCFILSLEFRQGHAEILLKLQSKCCVFFNAALAHRDFEAGALGCGFAFNPHRNQQQRGQQGAVAGFRFPPFQETKRQIKRVNAFFFPPAPRLCD